MRNITVLKVEVGSEPEVVTVEHSLESFHKLVGGFIEQVRLSEDIYLIVNEEGMIHDLPVNFQTVVVRQGMVVPVHLIYGNVFFVSDAGDEFASLDKLQIQTIKDMFKYKREICVVNTDLN